jgi:hypothetical protein
MVQVAARLPWWSALLLGTLLYLLIAVGLGGYLETQLAAQEGSRLYPMIEAAIFNPVVQMTAFKRPVYSARLPVISQG